MEWNSEGLFSFATAPLDAKINDLTWVQLGAGEAVVTPKMYWAYKDSIERQVARHFSMPPVSFSVTYDVADPLPLPDAEGWVPRARYR